MALVDPTIFDDLFDEVQQQADLDKWIEGKESGYEDKAVRKVMTSLGLATSIPELQRQVNELNAGKTLLYFQAFHDVFPTFPVRLCAKSYVKAHEITIADLYKRFTKTRPYQTFMEMKETFADGEQYGSWGLIFPWNGLGQVILHNNRHLDVGGTRVIKSVGDKTLYLDILTEFLTATSKVWQP